MIIETRLDQSTVVYIDAEAVGGVQKDQMEIRFHPDDALDHVVQIAAGVGRHLAVAAAGAAAAAPKPGQLEVEFGVKIDSNSTVAVARTPGAGQFRVRVTWTP